MRKFGERVGRLDDESVIYRADDPEQRVHWGRAFTTYVVGGLVVGGLLTAGRALNLSEGTALVAIAAGTVAFLVGYVIWRRRRNKRLTGSPTTWPS